MTRAAARRERLSPAEVERASSFEADMGERREARRADDADDGGGEDGGGESGEKNAEVTEP